MASLHSVSQHIDEYASLSRKLFSTLEALADDRRAADQEDPRAIVERIVALDRILHKEVDQIEEHQRWQQRILEVEAAIEACDRAAEQLVRTLHNAKMTLEDTVDAARQQIAKADAHAPLDYRDVLAYARRLAPYTSAPPKFDPTNPSHAFEKPFPDEQMMRAGRLGRLEMEAMTTAVDGNTQTNAKQETTTTSANTTSAGMQDMSAHMIKMGLQPESTTANTGDADQAPDDFWDLDL